MDRDALASFHRSQNAVDSSVSLATARWARIDELEKHQYDPKRGVYLGEAFPSQHPTGLHRPEHLIGSHDDRHIIVKAGTRAGKGVSFIIPNLLRYEGNVFVLDFKGDNATLTAERRGNGNAFVEGLGQGVHAIDPFRVSDVPDEYRATFNPLEEFPRDDTLIYEAGSLASAIVIASERSDPYWRDSARNLIATIIMHIMTSEAYRDADEPENEYERLPRNLPTVRKLLMVGSVTYQKYQAELIQLEVERCQERLEALQADEDANERDLKKAENDLAKAEALTPPRGLASLLMEMEENDALEGVISARAQAFSEIPFKERGSILSTARHETEFLDGSKIGQCLARSSFKMSDLRDKPTSVYLCLPTRHMDTHSRWLRSILGFTLNQFERIGLAQPDQPQTLFILDEMAVLGHMKIIEKAAGLMAGYGLKLVMILQSLGQLETNFKDGWETFLGNAGVIMGFGLSDNKTLDYLSKALGKIEIERRIVNAQEAKTSGQQQSVGAPAGADYKGSLFRAALEEWQMTKTGENKSSSTTETTSTTTSLSIGNLLNPDEIRHLFARETQHALVLMQGERPMALHRSKYFESPLFYPFQINEGVTKEEVLADYERRKADFRD